MLSPTMRANESVGHLSVHVEGQHPLEIPFLFERSHTRIAPAAVASALWHVAFCAALIVLLRGSDPGSATRPVFSAQPDPRLVWFDQPGPGGGGGGGGDNHKEPPRRAERPGQDPITVPVAQSRSLEMQRTPSEPDPIEGVIIPAKSLADAQDSIPGAIEAPAAPTLSLGPGSARGAGDGDGNGIGSGRGRGLGPGDDQNTGGRTYRPGAGVISPRLLHEMKPQYTADAMRAKVQGTVLLACVVRPDGSVGDVQVVRSLDSTFGLDDQAIRAVRQWKFAAGTRMGEPVSVQITIELTFTLR
jgi:periplasmic protein TonB